MPVLERRFYIPYPGHVNIHLGTLTMCFDEQFLKIAILRIKAKKDSFKDETFYKSTLAIYEQALRLLEEEKK